MFVSGFTFVRNAIKYDYPIKEAILSILPICDEVVVAVGNSEDGTLEFIKSLESDKIRIIETVWDDSLREGGRVLAVETDKAFKAINPKADWAFYIQGDEVIHEKYLEEIKQAMQLHLHNDKVDGLLFNYKHFYGSYDYVGESYRWYRKEIRVVKNNPDIFSYRDAQGFRKKPNEKLCVKPINAFVYHYGWVKDPRAQQLKQETFNKLWHSDDWVEKNIVKSEAFDYGNVDALEKFEDAHPLVMKDRINRVNWKFDFDISQKRYKTKEKLKRMIEKLTGYRIGEYKNYKVV